MINCSECGQQISEQSEYCPHCGAPVQSRTVFCRECGQKIDESADVCPNCGAPRGAVPVTVQNTGGTHDASAESGSIAICAMIFSFLFPPLGLVLGIIGLKRQNYDVNLKLCKIAIAISFILGILYTILIVNLAPFVTETVGNVEKGNRIMNDIENFFDFF